MYDCILSIQYKKEICYLLFAGELGLHPDATRAAGAVRDDDHVVLGRDPGNYDANDGDNGDNEVITRCWSCRPPGPGP